MSTQTDLEAMRDELELLGSMIRAERATPTQASQECTEEQLERCYALRDRLSLTQPKEGLSDSEIERLADELCWTWKDHDQCTSIDGYKRGLRYLRESGLLAAHSEVEELVRIVRGFTDWFHMRRGKAPLVEAEKLLKKYPTQP